MTSAPSYQEYLEARGYPASMPPLRVIRRMFVDCWFEPGFHNFWRTWSPLAGFVLHRLYRTLGGRENRPLAVVITFLSSGLVFHDLPLMFLLGKPLLVCTGAWFFFALATLVSARAVPPGWARASYALLNLGLVAVGFLFGRWLNGLLLGYYGV